MIQRYNRYLSSRAEGGDSYFGPQTVAYGWFILALPLLPIGLVFTPSGPLWGLTIGVVMAVSLVGGIYSSVFVFLHARRVERRERDVS